MPKSPDAPSTDSATTKPWFVYIIRTRRGRFYTGISTDVLRRLKEHQTGKRGAKYFNSQDIDALLFVEAASNRSMATKREIAIKRLAPREKQILIKFQAPVAISVCQ